MRNGQLYLQVHWEPVTSVRDGSVLPTPIASKAVEQRTRFNQGGYSLRAALDREMLPTPTTMDHLPQRSPEALKRQMEGPRKGRTKLANLREAVNPETQKLFNSMLPTPTASEHKARITNQTTQAGKCLSAMARRNELSTPTGEDMFLNASFVEEMMGYEVGWTDLKH